MSGDTADMVLGGVCILYLIGALVRSVILTRREKNEMPSETEE